jgi:hypothetical protein
MTAPYKQYHQDFESAVDKVNNQLNFNEIYEAETTFKFDRKRQGACPYCGSGTGSHKSSDGAFTFYPSINIAKCYSCGTSAGIVSLVMHQHNCQYKEAIHYLAANYLHTQLIEPGTKTQDLVSKMKPKKKLKISERKKVSETERLAEEEEKQRKFQYIKSLVLEIKDKTVASDYLQSRGLDVAKLPGDSYHQAAPYNNLPAGVVFLDSTGSLINKRYISQELPAGVPKMFAYGNLVNAVYDKTYRTVGDSVYITEGVINALSLYQCDKSSIALFATTNYISDVEKFKPYFNEKNIILAFDADKAGMQSAIKQADFIHRSFNIKSITVLVFPDTDDANDLLQSKRLSSYINEPYHYVELNKKLIDKELEKIKVDQKNYVPKLQQKGLYNFEAAKIHIRSEGFCNITTNCDKAFFKELNTVGFHEDNFEQLLKIKSITKSLVLTDKLPAIAWDQNGHEPEIIKICKKLVAYGFNLKVNSQTWYESDDDATKIIGFIQFYTDELASSVPIGDTIARTEAVKKAAEFLVTLDSSSYTVEYTSVYKKFFLNKADWNSIAKEYLSKEKHRQIYSDFESGDGVDIAEITDLNNLPSYVNPNDFYRKGYFAAQNKEGKEVLYMFRSKENGLFMASNFAMKMIGHLYANESSKNKRIVKITDEYGSDFYMEIESSTIRSFNEFSNRIYEESNLFFFGSKKQYEMLLKEVSNNIPKWIELEVLGQNENDFYSFADGLYNYREQKFLPIDELGTVAYKNTTYYIPAFSSIYNKINGNNPNMGSAKFLRYNKTRRGVSFDHTSFYKWSELMAKVYQEDNAGMFAVIFTIMAAFRDFIYTQHRRFPLFFLSGPTNSGKSQVADSIQAPFAHGMQIYNLNSGTDAAFFVSLEKFRNVPMIFDEYNDVQISKIKFQGLKAGYDGVGKQKKKDVHSKIWT